MSDGLEASLLAPEPDEQPDYQSSLEKARGAGFQWSDIWSHLFSSTAEADKAGYTQPEIDQHLGFADPAGAEARMKASWATTIASDPAVLDDMADGKVDLATNPDMRTAYTEALKNGEVKGPQDFAERYGASAVAAAHEVHGLDDQDGSTHLAAASAAAGELAPTLPTREDLADATVALRANNSPPQMPGPGFIPGTLHLDPTLAPKVPEGEARPFAPGESIDNPDGTHSSEISVSVENPILNGGKPTNIPSLWLKDGKAYVAHDEDEAAELAVKSGLTWPTYPTIEAADKAAGEREDVWNAGVDPSKVQALYNKTTRNNLLDHWAQTGQQPIEASILAQRDPALNDKLLGITTEPVPAFGYDPTAKINQYRDAIDGLYAPGEELAQAKSPLEGIKDIAEDVRDVGLGLLGGEVVGRGAAIAGEYVVAPLARAAMRLVGEIPEALRGLMDKTTTSVVNLAKDPGYAISDMSITDAMRAPKPAAFEPAPTPVEGAKPEPPKFTETSTPAERIARIAQDLTDEPLPPDPFHNTGNFFQRKLTEMGETDPATVALARGADDTARIRTWFKDIWSDESGAGFNIAAPSAEVADRDLGRDYAEGLIRHISTGLGTQKTEHIAQAFEAFFKDLAPFMPRYERELAKPFGGDWANTEVGKLINAVEGQGAVHPDSPLHPLYQFMLDVNDKHKADIEAAVAKGDLNPVQFREFYLPHLYTPESISAVKRGAGTGGIQGSLGFTKPRTQPTYADAIGEGYKPLHANPIVTLLHGLDASRKALNTVKMQGLARDDHWMRYYTDPREAARDSFRPLVGLNSEKLASTITKNAKRKSVPGPVVKQTLYGREGFDTIWNNWTRFENLQRSKIGEAVEDGLLKIKNTTTYMKLVLPLYHTITMYKEGWSNAWANAMTELAGGEIGRGIWDAAKAPITPIEYVVKAGLKWRPMYRAMEEDPALDAFVGGGGSLAARSKVYQAGSTPTLWRLWRRGTLTQDLAKDLTNALTFPAARAGDSVWTDMSNLATAPFREIGRVTTSISAPIWDHLVPLMKGGAAIERIQTFIRQNPTATDDMVRDYARKVVTNIEDRLGEYNSANLFWRPAVKRIANQTMLSTGWAYGTIHATLQGMGFNPSRGGLNPLAHFEWNPVATTNLAANLGMIAFTNAAWGLLVDGKLPDNKLDYMIPFANARGIARVLIPGEEKEYYDWMKIAAETFSTYEDKGFGAGALQALRSTTSYAAGKLAPPYQAAKDWMAGEYYNTAGKMTKIIPTPAGVRDWLTSEFLPIFANSWDKNAAAGLNAVENLVGMREAPKWFENWDAWRQGQEKLHNRWTKEELKIAGQAAPQTPRPQRTPGDRQYGSRAARTRDFLLNEQTATQRANQLLDHVRTPRGTQGSYTPGVDNQGAAPRGSEQQVYTGQGTTTVLRGDRQSPTLETVRRAPRTYTPRRSRRR